MNTEKSENKLELKTLKLEDLIKYLVDNPIDSEDILGYVLKEEDAKKFVGLRREHVEEIIDRMGLKDSDPRMFEEVFKNLDNTESPFLKPPKFIPKEE